MCLEDQGVAVGATALLRVTDLLASSCGGCGATFPLEQFEATYVGHTEKQGGLYDALQLTEPYICPECYAPVFQVDLFCREVTIEGYNELFGIS